MFVEEEIQFLIRDGGIEPPKSLASIPMSNSRHNTKFDVYFDDQKGTLLAHDIQLRYRRSLDLTQRKISPKTTVLENEIQVKKATLGDQSSRRKRVEINIPLSAKLESQQVLLEIPVCELSDDQKAILPDEVNGTLRAVVAVVSTSIDVNYDHVKASFEKVDYYASGEEQVHLDTEYRVEFESISAITNPDNTTAPSPLDAVAPVSLDEIAEAFLAENSHRDVTTPALGKHRQGRAHVAEFTRSLMNKLDQALPANWISYAVGFDQYDDAERMLASLSFTEQQRLRALVEMSGYVSQVYDTQTFRSWALGSSVVDKNGVAGNAPLKVLREANTSDEINDIIHQAKSFCTI